MLVYADNSDFSIKAINYMQEKLHRKDLSLNIAGDSIHTSIIPMEKSTEYVFKFVPMKQSGKKQ